MNNIKSTSYIDIVLKDILKRYNLNENTIQDYDLFLELIYDNMRPILFRKFDTILYIESFIDEKDRLYIDEDYYNKQYTKYKQFVPIDKINSKNKLILFMAVYNASSYEFSNYDCHHIPKQDFVDKDKLISIVMRRSEHNGYKK